MSNNQDFMKLIDASFPKRGDLIKAEVIKVEPTTIWINVNAQTEGRMHLDNYTKDPTITSFEGIVKKGDIIEAVVQKVQDDPALILLSRLPILQKNIIQEIIEKCENHEAIKCRVKLFNKGGMIAVYNGLEVFLPFRNLDYDMKENQDKYIGKTIECLIEEANFVNKRNPNIVGTRRPIIQAERQRQFQEERNLAKAELDSIKSGDVLTGTVLRLLPYAALIIFKNQKGMLRISQISHHRIEKIEDVLKVGDEVKVKVIKKENGMLDLSMKELIPTPFEEFIKVHKTGDDIKGVIVQKLPYGFFLEIAKGVKALLPRSEFNWDPKDNFGTQAKIGSEIDVKIIKIDPIKKQIALSRKALIDNPWAKIELERGQAIECQIERFEENRTFVSFSGIEGYIKNEELDLKKGKPEDNYQVGDKLEAQVISFHKAAWILELSVKRLNQDRLRKDLDKALEEEEKNSSKAVGNKALKQALEDAKKDK